MHRLGGGPDRMRYEKVYCSGNKGEIRSIEGYAWVNRGMGTWKKDKGG